MKYLVIFLLLVGCSNNLPPSQVTYGNPPIVQIVVDPRAQQMSRNEVIQATTECETNNMRAVPVMSKRIVSGMMSDIIIDVQCMPRRSIF
jgi:hypothetical protein